jgi:hypothetical protein
MRERVHSITYGRFAVSNSTSDAKSEYKNDAESDCKTGGKVGGGKVGGGCRSAHCCKQDDDDNYNGDSDDSEGDYARRRNNDVRIEFTDVPLSPGLVAAGGLTTMPTRRRTYASEDATSLSAQINSEYDSSSSECCTRESFAASQTVADDEASFRDADKENVAILEEYKLALDAMRRLSDNLHNF